MNEMESLQAQLASALPGATIVVDRPDTGDPGSRWWLEVELDGHSATVDWKPNQGFGLSSTPTEGYGEGADEVYPDAASAAERIATLLRAKERTTPPREMLLGRLRQGRRVSQLQLARKLHVNQAAISKMERRSDMYISTLRKAVAALGGSLEIRARFPEGVVGINQFEELDPPARPRKRGTRVGKTEPRRRRATSTKRPATPAAASKRTPR